MRTYYVYIMASRSRVLYTGVTNDLVRRVDEHKRSLIPGFTSRYHITRLVYFEELGDVRDAIAREKQLKGWVRSRKLRLIEQKNPTWEDLADTWFAARSRLVAPQKRILRAFSAQDDNLALGNEEEERRLPRPPHSLLFPLLP